MTSLDRAGDPLTTIDGFIVFLESVARRPRQKHRVLDAAGTRLSGAGLHVLRVLHWAGSLPMSDLARRLEVDQSTLSRQVRPLEDDGLVERTAGEADKRVAVLRLSASGRKVLDRIHRLRRRDLEVVLAGWTDDDRAELARLLDRFRASMTASPERPGGTHAYADL